MTQPKLSIRQVEIVDAVARHRSVSRAATELHVSQSALSHALGVIENGLGVKLFTRAQSGVEPTAFVEPFIARARALRSVIADTTRELEIKTKQPLKPLNIQCGFRTGALWVTPALAAVTTQSPAFQAEINFNVKNLETNLLSGATDIGLASPNEFNIPADFHVEPVGYFENRFFASPSHPLAHRAFVTLDDLRNYPMVGNFVLPPFTDILEGNPGRLGTYDPSTRSMQCAIVINTTDGVIDVLRRSEGVARLPPILTQEEVDAGFIIQLNDENIKRYPVYVDLIVRKTILDRQDVRLFVESLRNVAVWRRESSKL
ncbi:MAG: hypothetical protein RLZZ496_60 [Pseudomonadota bacterium]